MPVPILRMPSGPPEFSIVPPKLPEALPLPTVSVAAARVLFTTRPEVKPPSFSPPMVESLPATSSVALPRTMKVEFGLSALEICATRNPSLNVVVPL